MGGEKLSTTGTLRLDIPDTGISSIKVMKEEDGKRVLSIPVYNKNGTTLGNKGRVVKLALYEDNSYENDSLIGSVRVISDTDDLYLVDQGPYVETVEFDVQAYLTKHGLQEIPDKGITVYLRSWVEDAGGEVLKEFDESDNEAKITLDNLAVKYNENRVLLTLEQTNDATHTSVNLTMQNMNMAPVSSGNVLIHLLDAEGLILETKYVASDVANLLSFGAEEKKTVAVQFGQAGKSVQGVFFHENADQLDATLSTVKLNGIALDFKPNQTSYALQTGDLKQTKLVAVASNSESTVTVMDGAGEVIDSHKGFVAIDQPLLLSAAGSVNEWQIEIQPASAAAPNKTYQLAVTNTESSKPQLELTVKGTKRGDGTYSGQVEVAMSPYTVDGFSIDKVLYKVNNGNWQEIAYDGKAEKSLETLAGEGVYRVDAKVVLASGMTYDLAPAVFEIKADVQPTPPAAPTPSGAPTPTAAPTPTGAPTPQPTAASIFKSDIVHWEELLQSMKDRLRSTSAGEKKFSDTQQHWAQSMIDWLARLGVINGYADGKFKPNHLITRAEFSAIIVRLFMLKPDDDNASGFIDVNGHWAENDIAILAKHDLVKGYQDRSFQPDSTITREEMITMIMRLVDESVLPQPEETQFEDWSNVSMYARHAILTAANAGIIQGYMGELRPQGEATRAETVVMLWKLLMLNSDIKVLY